VRRGEIRWYRFRAPDKRRPVLLLTRDVVIDALNEIIAVPVTRTIRGIATEVLLTEEDGLPTTCALNLDHVGLARRSCIEGVITTLPIERWEEVEHALMIACGFCENDDRR
jgi:mRNA interferase MazF